MEISLGLGSTDHWEAPAEGEVGRKGISCERTFHAISSREDLECKVNLDVLRISMLKVVYSLHSKTFGIDFWVLLRGHRSQVYQIQLIDKEYCAAGIRVGKAFVR